jgi:hypothetical protein
MHTAADIIRALALAPHPEGGHYRETFRDPRVIDGRAASTSIYFLLKRGERSHWHRIDAVEVWHYYAGAALKLEVVDGARRRSCGSAPISTPARRRSSRCRCAPGKPPNRLATGRWWAARWRRVSPSTVLSSRRQVGRRQAGSAIYRPLTKARRRSPHLS